MSQPTTSQTSATHASPEDVPRVVVNVLSGCPHCTRARALLRRRGIEHEVVSGDGQPDFRRKLAAATGGSTVPQIVIDGQPVGGADDLARLDRAGVLEALVTGGTLPVIRARKRWWRRAGARWRAEALDATGVVARADGGDEAAARAALGACLPTRA